ncbi:hypothetical protein EJB05_19824, partial [Eragrostis curvula]
EETYFVLIPSPGGLTVLGSQWAPSLQDDGFDKWVLLQQSDSNKDIKGEEKDAALSSAEAKRVNNEIDQTNDLGGENGYYTTISEAIANIPDNNTKRYTLILKAGTVFREKVFLNRSKPFVTLKSDPTNPATIVWNDTATTLGKDNKPLGNVGSSTVTIESDYFIAYNVIFKNDAPKGQASALRVSGTKATFYNSTIDGGQGALYDQKGLHYFKSCTIKGTVDFIFGLAKSLYEDCNIVSVNKDITAVSTAPPQQPLAGKPVKVAGGESGFSFKNCTINGDGQQIYLGRVSGGSPVVYSFSEIGKEIVPISWARRKIQKPESGIYYGDFKCYGPGFDAIKKAKWSLALTEAQAKPFIGTSFISGDSWILALPPS